MRDRLKDEAEKNARSMNAEIVQRLERTFTEDDRAVFADRLREAVETGSSAPRLQGEPLKYPVGDPEQAYLFRAIAQLLADNRKATEQAITGIVERSIAEIVKSAVLDDIRAQAQAERDALRPADARQSSARLAEGIAERAGKLTGKMPKSKQQ
jgi:hypothetical protein